MKPIDVKGARDRFDKKAAELVEIDVIQKPKEPKVEPCSRWQGSADTILFSRSWTLRERICMDVRRMLNKWRAWRRRRHYRFVNDRRVT